MKRLSRAFDEFEGFEGLPWLRRGAARPTSTGIRSESGEKAGNPIDRGGRYMQAWSLVRSNQNLVVIRGSSLSSSSSSSSSWNTVPWLSLPAGFNNCCSGCQVALQVPCRARARSRPHIVVQLQIHPARKPPFTCGLELGGRPNLAPKVGHHRTSQIFLVQKQFLAGGLSLLFSFSNAPNRQYSPSYAQQVSSILLAPTRVAVDEVCDFEARRGIPRRHKSRPSIVVL